MKHLIFLLLFISTMGRVKSQTKDTIYSILQVVDTVFFHPPMWGTGEEDKTVIGSVWGKLPDGSSILMWTIRAWEVVHESNGKEVHDAWLHYDYKNLLKINSKMDVRLNPNFKVYEVSRPMKR